VRNGAWQSATAGLLALAAVGVLAAAVLAARPLEGWLLLDLGILWGWQLMLALACGSFGWLLVDRILGLHSLPGLEKLAHALALGFLAFGAFLYVGGYLGLYGPVFAVALPVALVAAGLPVAWPAARRWALRARVGSRLSPLALAATLGGTLALGILYLGLLSPAALLGDASWNHLVISQDYAREGRIVPFLADWMKNVPHLGSVVNTWAFLVPGLDEPALRWMMALHNEFTVLGFTLVGIAAGVRFLAVRDDVRGAWACLFLFPGIFVFDGNLGGAADHFAALFAVPVVLAFARWLATPEPRYAVLLGALAGGALLAKLHLVYLLVPIGVVATVFVAGAPRQRLPSAALVAGVAVAIAALHFGRSWVFYGSPFYPLAQDWFGGVPTLPDAALHFDLLQADWRFLPPADIGERTLSALRHSFLFSFSPQYWFSWNHPTFGSLFTLLLPLLLVLGRVPRLWLAVGIGWGALFTWAFTFPIDRNLQTFAPLLAATTGALLVRGFELGRLARLGLSALVGLQLVWGADYFFSGGERIRSSLALIRSGLTGTAEDRYRPFRSDYLELGRWLPKDAVLLLHTHHQMLGIDRPVLLDWAGFQGLIDYRPFQSAHDLDQSAHDLDARLRELGVTHVVWVPDGPPAPSKQADVLFHALIALHEKETRSFGPLRVAPLGDDPPPVTPPLEVVVIGAPGYADGLYPVALLSTLERMPPELRDFAEPAKPARRWSDAAALAQEAGAVILGRRAAASERALPEGLYPAARFGPYTLYLRRD
jgi:hypothetical protein